MLLSKLVYQAIVASDSIGDGGLSYEDFLTGFGADNDSYSKAINLVFVPLNEYFQRLSNLDKIPYQTLEVGEISSSSPYLDLSKLTDSDNQKIEVKKIISVFQFIDGNDYRTIEYREVGNKIRLVGKWYEAIPVCIQYAVNVPMFSLSDIPNITIDDNGNETTHGNDTDFFDKYGITNDECAYAMEWVQGKMLEDSAPELGNLHINHVESYLAGLDVRNTSFTQKVVERKFSL